ncbi:MULTISPECIES: 4-hydroxy-tetrahydrodipicolinate synthase [unclassified Agarivorans]|uniref:4-hydroxy-tetrahydrodipicolinate synthase n=1 Tax=unclassified Agarivorans TaxID=2636026 RepID=UPI0010DD509A|nr:MULTISPECIES: 4-hydroxy-tetrahydrodipicolinate synthase [unclassified Agarivorans]MDO6684521.1 4-hydroxy-tetrahydrodipicolinate synthase [Agarivorans sp. 3_MG-2023]MDO6714686.1 4-hydroxy-tetrahydrodipicolinate synthase [Agarivorans sp. 2_MG-2023]MDO6762920.1 4-hydroxy-tetrahydrodipicolinate synthase [Agarivorans sp. 1_MG-2023]GDY24638.1 4-hydroxy-tetrahydrodipicolinate synthase [Agarivorans sp. Toyoura001]
MFKGSIVALVTPFIEGEVDYAAIRELVEWHIGQGTHGIVPVGTTGESPTLTHDEHIAVVKTVVEQAKGRVPVIAGAGSNNPIEAIEYTKAAQQVGADATLHVAGYYNRPNQDGLFQHFKMLHDATDIPIVLYNIPPRAVVDLSPVTIAKLAQLPRIVGVKDATGDLSRPLFERQLIEQDFCWLSGEDATAVSYNISGGQGCISVTANVAPKLCAQMQQATLDGDYAKASEIQDKLIPLHQAMFAEPSPAGAKYAMSLLNKCRAECRLPVTELSDSTKTRIRNVMQSLELI